jgi:hypothetical protein
MARPSVETGRSLDRTSAEFGEAPTVPFMREPLVKEEVYARPTEVFVAPPWRWSDCDGSRRAVGSVEYDTVGN